METVTTDQCPLSGFLETKIFVSGLSCGLKAAGLVGCALMAISGIGKHDIAAVRNDVQC